MHFTKTLREKKFQKYFSAEHSVILHASFRILQPFVYDGPTIEIEDLIDLQSVALPLPFVSPAVYLKCV